MEKTNKKDLGFANIQYTSHFSYNINKNSNHQESLEGFRAKIRKDLKNLKGEIIYTLLANIANVQTQFATKRERLTVEEIFITNEISREIVEIFIQTIVVDDINDKIEITLKKGENNE